MAYGWAVNQRLWQCWGIAGVLALALLLATGCASTRVDWAGRVGNYTLDQAVLELGPPDKQAKLADGTTVAEWLLRRGHNRLYAGTAYYPWWAGPAYPTYLETYTPDYFLRLVFDPAGRLKDWKQFVR